MPRGNWGPRDPADNEKQSRTMKQKVADGTLWFEEHRRNQAAAVSAALKGKEQTPEHRAKRSLSIAKAHKVRRLLKAIDKALITGQPYKDEYISITTSNPGTFIADLEWLREHVINEKPLVRELKHNNTTILDERPTRRSF